MIGSLEKNDKAENIRSTLYLFGIVIGLTSGTPVRAEQEMALVE